MAIPSATTSNTASAAKQNTKRGEETGRGGSEGEAEDEDKRGTCTRGIKQAPRPGYSNYRFAEVDWATFAHQW